MTRFDPSLRVTRLRVEKGAHVAYDQKFHEGVNIIRGENSSGKSTILNLLFFGLGGDLKDWSETALLCTRVLVEVVLSGKVATLARDISNARGQPMDIFAGELDDALKAPFSEWDRFPYSRGKEVSSFSEVIFRLLKFPEVTTEAAANVTLNQVLRLLYSDQLSPVDSIFKFEQFDPPALRDAVGRLLCGAFESEVYSNGLRIRDLQKEYDAVSAQLKSFYALLGRADQIPSLELFASEKSQLQTQRAELQAEIERMELQLSQASQPDPVSQAAQTRAYEQLRAIQQNLASAQSQRDKLLLEIADSDSFIAELVRKQEALDDASSVSEEIDDVRFHFCPACYAPTDAGGGPHACYLCKTPFDTGRATKRIAAIISDLTVQLKQSRILQDRRRTESERVASDLDRLQREWRDASRRYDEAQRNPSSEAQQKLNQFLRAAGYLERQIEDIEEKVKLAQVVSELTDEKARLNTEITTLGERNSALQYSQQVNLANAYTRIADEVRQLLKGDISRQDSFEDPKNIQFDFANNKITVDDHTYFSASSRVILRNSFFVGFLTAAANDVKFRHPRFCMLDSIEDKGMEVERAHNFQRMIVSNVKRSSGEAQVIFGTSMIAPEFDTDEYVIGKKSTRASRTLAIG